jgi:hypothetical protein
MKTNMNRWLGGLLVLALVLSFLPGLVSPSPASAATTSLTVTRYDAHGAVLGTQTVTYQWMEANLPVQGDGTIRYYAQGPTFTNTNFNTVWNPTEDVNVESRDYGRAKGTDVKDLCNLVGATPGCTIKIKAADNFAKWFDYEDVYNPEPRQGKMVVCWYNADFGGYVPAYSTGMRLLFFADNSTNPMGWHAFGDWDMHETLPESRWHYYSGQWPSSSGLSVQIVSNIDIYEPNVISCNASGTAKESFVPGETVYVKGAGLAASTSYKLWIQAEPVSNNKLSIVDGNDPVLLPAYEFNAGNDPSGAQETVTTNASGDFSTTAIWTIASSATPQKYDIVADSQASGTIGKYDPTDVSSTSKKDYMDAPGWEGFTVTEPPLTITASAGAHGSITPSGSVSVPSGGSQTFSITPNTGYHVSNVLVDGGSVGAVTSYTFTNVTANHTISASFAINTYTITASAGAHGSITPSGTVSVNYGASQTFSITPSTGYHVSNVLVDGGSVGAVTSYTFTNVAANHTISASFAEGTAPDWDLNGDGVINIGDVVVVGLHWGETGTPGWIPQDLNNDGVVNIGDVVVVGLHWGETW